MAIRLEIDICQPTMHGTITFCPVFNLKRNLMQLFRNGMWPLFSESAHIDASCNRMVKNMSCKVYSHGTKRGKSNMPVFQLWSHLY